MKTIVVDITDEADEIIAQEARKAQMSKSDFIKHVFKVGLAMYQIESHGQDQGT